MSSSSVYLTDMPSVRGAPVVQRFKVYFLYAIDLGYLLTPESRERLQELRAKGEIQESLIKVFVANAKDASAWVFKDPKIEQQKIKSRAEQAEKKKGKNIWSDLFFEKQVPIWFMPKTTFRHLVPSSNSDEWGNKLEFERCEFRIFKEGILVFSYKFRNEQKHHRLAIDDMIDILAGLEERTTQSFVYGVIEMAEEWSQEVHPFQQLSLEFHKRDERLRSTIRTSSVQHSCIFLEGLEKTEEGEFDINTQRFLLGMLNRTSWYKRYSERYIAETFEKDVGYRKDEIYLTDKDSTLILLKDYWDKRKPLRFYMDDLMLAIQLQVAKQAYLNFFLRYMQSSKYSQKMLIDPSGDEAAELVLRARNILTLLQESTDIDSLVVHGFTRKFLERLVIELKIDKYLALIESRIANISDAIQLKSARDINEQNIKLDQLNIRLAKYSVVFAGLALFLTALQVILRVVMNALGQ